MWTVNWDREAVLRFLCAEDNDLNAEILTELLKIEGAECTICENGERILEAFEQSAPGDYDMILMDVQMPVMNGYEATKAIRRSSYELEKTIRSIKFRGGDRNAGH